jgi:glucose/arabinose dehydrogenase
MMRRFALLAVAILACVAAPAVAQNQTKAPRPAEQHDVRVETIARGLEHPWAVQLLPDGRFLVTERPGRMRIVSADGRLSDPVQGVPTVAATNQGGLLDVVLDPRFAETRTIYFTYAEPRGAGTNGTSVARARLVLSGNGGRLDDMRVIFRQLPATSGGLHFGSRIAIARDGNLFVALGERYQSDRAQEVGTHYGKVIRIRPDGSVPPDNPFLQNQTARPELWSIGHRNPQSAAIHPSTGKLWIVEHGARGGDEVNVPAAGKNYGWPIITYGRDYSGAKIGIGTEREGLEQPIYYWDPSIAPSGMAFYVSDRAPRWRNSMFVGALAGRHLVRLVLDGEKIVAEERLLADLRERIRDVRLAPDGSLIVVTDSADGRILRVTPLP